VTAFLMPLYLFAMDHGAWLTRAIAETVYTADDELDVSRHRASRFAARGWSGRALAHGVPRLTRAIWITRSRRGYCTACQSDKMMLAVPTERGDQEVVEPQHGYLVVTPDQTQSPPTEGAHSPQCRGGPLQARRGSYAASDKCR